MKFSKTIKREFEVAFSKNAQPVWFRVVKYALLLGFLYFFWNSSRFWIILAIVLVLSLILHFWYRFKTAGWNKSYGGWVYEKNRSSLDQ